MPELSDVDKCPVCSHREYKLRTQVKGYTYITCRDCTVSRTHPFPSLETIKSWYEDSDYFKHDDRNVGYSDYTEQKDDLIHTSTKRFKKLGVSFQGSLLELGCGYGYAGLAFKQAGGNSYLGIDLNEHAVEMAAKNGLDCKVGSVDVLQADQAFDYIIFFDVLEHVGTPNEFINGLTPHLNAGGKLIFTTPNTSSLLAKISGKHWVSYIVPQHILLFSEAGAEKLLTQCGFTDVRFKPDTQSASVPFILERLSELVPLFRKSTKLKQWLKTSSFLKAFPHLSVPNGNMLVEATFSGENKQA